MGITGIIPIPPMMVVVWCSVRGIILDNVCSLSGRGQVVEVLIRHGAAVDAATQHGKVGRQATSRPFTMLEYRC
jgi:hypothetical protein